MKNMFKKIINNIVIFFSLFFGFSIPKTKDETHQPESIVAISREQEQEELDKFLTEECVVYDPNSPEAIAELSVMGEMLGDIDDSIYDINLEDDKLRNKLKGKYTNYGS